MTTELKHLERKLPGHRLNLKWNGEIGRESRVQATCECGQLDMECVSRAEARNEFQDHLERVLMDQRGLVTMHALPWW